MDVCLPEHGKEIKGSKLLERKHFRWAEQMDELPHVHRRKAVRRFLTQNAQSHRPSRRDFTAYGQACLLMADGIFALLQKHQAVLFASLIAKGCKPPPGHRFPHFLRKDHVFLQERFFYFLEREQAHGIMVMDQTEARNDLRFVRRLRDYYSRTQRGRERARWIVPEPLFVDSSMYPAIQAADLCIYCINWGYREEKWAYHGDVREEIRQRYVSRIDALQFRGKGQRGEQTFFTKGIVFVPDPFEPRT